jgi:hypothetical protein
VSAGVWARRAHHLPGNDTNVTSDLEACIAAGLTVHLVKRDHRRAHELEEHFRLLHDSHAKLEAELSRGVSAAQRAEAAAINGGKSSA